MDSKTTIAVAGTGILSTLATYLILRALTSDHEED